MTQQSLRRVTESDAALLAELGARTFSDTFANQNTPEDMDAYPAQSFGTELQRAELADPQNTFLIIESEGVAIGYTHLRAGSLRLVYQGLSPSSLAGSVSLQRFREAGSERN